MQYTFPRARYQCLEGIPLISRAVPGYWAYLAVWSNSRIIILPTAKLLWKYINPKDNGSFILESLTNRSHQVNPRSLLGTSFEVVVYNETGWPMLNVHLIYKPPSSWRILFRSGGIPMQFIFLKKGSWYIPEGSVIRGWVFRGDIYPQFYL